jgi:hypothetical protein
MFFVNHMMLHRFPPIIQGRRIYAYFTWSPANRTEVVDYAQKKNKNNGCEQWIYGKGNRVCQAWKTPYIVIF